MVDNGNGTITFDSEYGRFRFTCKSLFVRGDSERLSEPVYKLMNDYRLNEHLHSETGPAIVHLTTGHQEYWINGKPVTGEALNKIKHKVEFHNKFSDFLKGYTESE